MATLAQLVVKIAGDTGQLEAALGRAEGKTGAFGSAVGKLGSKMGTALKVGGVAAAAGIGVAAASLVSFTKSAAEEQVGIERLQTAIKTLDGAHVGSAATVEKLVQQREKLSFSDDDLRQSLSLLIPATGDYEEAVRRQGIAMDMTRGTGIDLETTSRLLGKVTDESVNVFKRYGITLDKNATETEALAAVQAKFAGQSEAYANTAAGKWERFGNQMDNIKETIGAALLPVVTQLAGKLNEFITDHQADIDEFSKALGEKIPDAIDAIGEAIDKAKPALEFIFKNVKDGFDTIRPALEWVIDNKVAMVAALTAIGVAALLAFSPITLPILAVVAGLVGLMFTIGLVRNHWDEIKTKTLEVWGTISTFMDERLGVIRDLVVFAFEDIKAQVTLAFNVVRDIFKIAMALIHGDWGAAWDGVKQLFSDVWDGIVELVGLRIGLIRDIVAAIPGMLLTFVGAFGSAAAALGGAILDGMKNALSNTAGVAGDVAEAVFQAIRGVVNDMIGRINRALEFTITMPGAIPNVHIDPPDIPQFARGGFPAAGKPVIVGERGPEIAAFPGGTRIYSNRESQAMVRGATAENVSSGQSVNVNITGPVTINNQQDVDSTAGRIGWSIALGMRARGVWA